MSVFITNKSSSCGGAVITPSFQTFSSGSAQVYTKPTSPAPLYIRVVMVGGGGPGGESGTTGSGSGVGTTGGNTLFSAILTANGGVGGGGGHAGNAGGAGGTASIGSTAYGIAVTGGGGN